MFPKVLFALPKAPAFRALIFSTPVYVRAFRRDGRAQPRVSRKARFIWISGMSIWTGWGQSFTTALVRYDFAFGDLSFLTRSCSDDGGLVEKRLAHVARFMTSFPRAPQVWYSGRGVASLLRVILVSLQQLIPFCNAPYTRRVAFFSFQKHDADVAFLHARISRESLIDAMCCPRLSFFPVCLNLQAAYSGLLQVFITRRAVCLLVCDMSAFENLHVPGIRSSEDKDIEKLEALGVCRWLRCLSWRVPGSDVILVGTKCDLLQKKALGDISRRIQDGCRKWLSAWKNPGSKVHVEPGLSLTSCAAPAGCDACTARMRKVIIGRMVPESGQWSCDRSAEGKIPNKGLLQRITFNHETNLPRGTTMVIPRGWNVALTVLEALSMGRRVKHGRDSMFSLPLEYMNRAVQNKVTPFVSNLLA